MAGEHCGVEGAQRVAVEDPASPCADHQPRAPHTFEIIELDAAVGQHDAERGVERIQGPER